MVLLVNVTVPAIATGTTINARATMDRTMNVLRKVFMFNPLSSQIFMAHWLWFLPDGVPVGNRFS
jgi:hypothetical protein